MIASLFTKIAAALWLAMAAENLPAPPDRVFKKELPWWFSAVFVIVLLFVAAHIFFGFDPWLEIQSLWSKIKKDDRDFRQRRYEDLCVIYNSLLEGQGFINKKNQNYRDLKHQFSRVLTLIRDQNPLEVFSKEQALKIEQCLKRLAEAAENESLPSDIGSLQTEIQALLLLIDTKTRNFGNGS